MGFNVELWVEYGLGVFTFLLRFFARWKVVGLRNFAWDDFFSFIAMLMWTADACMIYIVHEKGSFVGLNDQKANGLTDAQVHNYTIGSKALFTAWLTYVTLIWSLKASLLFFYARLTLHLAQKILVKIMGAICVVVYIATVLVLFLHCTPIQKNWQIKPYAGDACTLTVLNYIFVAIANLFTDAGILAIPIPLIYSIHLPIHRKIIIALLLCSAVPIMTAALLRCILSLGANGDINNSMLWGTRETLICILAISAPAIKPIFSKSRWIGSENDRNVARSGVELAFPRMFPEPDPETGASNCIGPANGNAEKGHHQRDVERGEYHGIDETPIQSLPPSWPRTKYSTLARLWKTELPNPVFNPKKESNRPMYAQTVDIYDFKDILMDWDSTLEEEEFTPALISWLACNFQNSHVLAKGDGRSPRRIPPTMGDPKSRSATVVQSHKLLGLTRPRYQVQSHHLMRTVY